VDPANLQLSPIRQFADQDPQCYGQSVGVVIRYVPDSNNATISITRVDPNTGKTSVGPVVMTYGSYSDTRPVTAYGGGWLWIYDNSTIQGSQTVNISNPGSAELLQVSTSSGLVVNTVSMPTLYRPIMATNDEGLWIGNSIEGGACEGCGPPSALYYVAPGSDHAVVAIPNSALVVCWLLGGEDHVWEGMGTTHNGCGQQTIWRLDGTDFQPTFQVPDEGYDPSGVIGDQTVGLWTTKWTSSSSLIVNINPNTGAESVVATLPPVASFRTADAQGLVQGQAVVSDGYLYLLEPPLEADGYLGYSTLVKVPIP